MDTLVARQAQRATLRAAIAPTKPYSPGGHWHAFSGTVNFASTASGAASAGVDIAAPTGLVLREGAEVMVATPAAFTAGANVVGKVKTGGAAVTVYLQNDTGGTYDAASTTLSVRVAK